MSYSYCYLFYSTLDHWTFSLQVFVNEVIEKIISNDWLAKRIVMLLLPVPATARLYYSNSNSNNTTTAVMKAATAAAASPSSTTANNQTCHHHTSPISSQKHSSMPSHQWIRYSNTLQQWLESYHHHHSPHLCCGIKRPFFLEYFEKTWRRARDVFFGNENIDQSTHEYKGQPECLCHSQVPYAGKKLTRV